MASNLADHIPISAIGTVSGNQERYAGYNEKATQTYFNGTPVQLTTGLVAAWDGVTIARGIAGIAPVAGANLASNGLGAPAPPFGSVGKGTTLTFGSVQFQSSAVNIPHGAPMNDGRALLIVANEDTLFQAQIDSASAAAYASSLSQIGVQYGLTKDATGHWYIDLDKVTTGTNTAVVIVGFSPLQAIGTNGAIAYFKFVENVCMLAPQ